MLTKRHFKMIDATMKLMQHKSYIGGDRSTQSIACRGTCMLYNFGDLSAKAWGCLLARLERVLPVRFAWKSRRYVDPRWPCSTFQPPPRFGHQRGGDFVCFAATSFLLYVDFSRSKTGRFLFLGYSYERIQIYKNIKNTDTSNTTML